MSAFSEEQIIRGLKEDNQPVLQYLYQEYGPGVMGIVIKNNGDEEDGYDLLQTTILKAWHNVKEGKYQHTGKFRQYFFSIAYNDWLYELRRRKNTGTIPIDDGEGRPIQLKDDGEGDLLRVIAKDHSLNVLYEALQKIGEGCKTILTLFYSDDLSSKEIAEQMNSTDGYVRKRLHECREKLKTATHMLLHKLSL